MSLYKAKDARAERARLWEEAQEIVTTAEADDSRDNLTSEEQEKFDRLHERMKELGDLAERLERQEDIARELSASRGREVAPEVEDRIEDRDEGPEYADVFERYLRFGMGDLTTEERQILSRGRAPAEERAQSVGTTTAGGFTVPDEAMAPIEDALLAFGGMRRVSNVISTSSGADLPVPTDDDTSNAGVLLAENTAAAEQDITFGQIVLQAFKYSSKLIRVSQELLQDSEFDIGAFIGRKLGERIGRITNTHFTTGTGSAQPNGVVTAATLGKTGATGQTGSVIYADLVDLQHSVDAAYREGAVWMMNDASVAIIKKLLDSNGLPLWQPGIALREPDTILGDPFVVNNDVATMAANAKSILYGDFSKYWIRDVRGIQVLRLVERYAEFHQVAFLAFARADGDLIDAGTNPVKFYANSAT